MMNSKRTVLLCLSGLDTRAFIEHTAPHVPRDRLLALLYVVDTRPAEELGYVARRLHAGPKALAGREAMMSAADEQTAQAVLDEARAACAQLGYSAQAIIPLVRRGRPEQQIIEVAQLPELNIGLVVIGSSYKRGPQGHTGPASVGHVARFVVDHSPCDVLLLR